MNCIIINKDYVHLNTQKLFHEVEDDRGSDRGVGRRLRDTIISPGSELFRGKRLGEGMHKIHGHTSR